MTQSVLEAIREGQWDFEPKFGRGIKKKFSSTLALPGTEEKVATLAERAQMGLPLWHPEDRRTYDDAFSGME